MNVNLDSEVIITLTKSEAHTLRTVLSYVDISDKRFAADLDKAIYKAMYEAE